MKTTKMLQRMAMFALLMSALVATSCDDDDDDSGLRVSKMKVELAPSATEKVTVSNGTEPYNAVSSDEKIVKAAVEKNTVTLTGVTEGKAIVVITDSKKMSASVGIEVKKPSEKK